MTNGLPVYNAKHLIYRILYVSFSLGAENSGKQMSINLYGCVLNGKRFNHNSVSVLVYRELLDVFIDVLYGINIVIVNRIYR